MPIETHVYSRRIGNKRYGVIWSLPEELIGKKVIILTEEEWSRIKPYLELLHQVIEEKVKEERKKIVKTTFEKMKNSLKSLA